MYEKLYKELVLRYNELEGRTKQLEEENARLRQRLGMANRSDTNNVKKILRYSTLLYIITRSVHLINKGRLLSAFVVYHHAHACISHPPAA